MSKFLAEHPLQLTPGTARDFGVARPLGKRLVRDVVGHVILWQLNVAFGCRLSCKVGNTAFVTTS